MKYSLCILIRRPPYGQIHAAEAVRHLGGALAEGIETSVLLMDDGVYLAQIGQDAGPSSWTILPPELSRMMTKGARVFVHSPSVRVRALAPDEHLIPGVELVEDDACARLLAGVDATMVY
jgi:sulfur relay (sulfurtransferase) DsrF/TusC family protein